ncbi:DUF2254 family protein [Sphingomonas sp.]|uniref:DUF2254 domain-containing protein n=1 Tax=Sphingomonas sp. TaxID=28214 RepID=UPI00289FC2FB|nr:DUF2254 family protein [Sphingomonas sp.]
MISLTRISRFFRHAGRQIWFRAAVISATSVVIAALAGIVARAIPYEFTGDVGQSAVGKILEIIASSMLAVTTFSMTAMVSAYSSATQLATPRATQLMISDRTSQNALSTFLGSFIFAVVGIIGLQTHLYGGQGRVVLLLATIILIVLVVVTLLRWIAHLAAFGRMADVIDRVENAACAAMSAFARNPYDGARPAIAVPASAMAICSIDIGYVTHIDAEALALLAQKHDLAIHVEVLTGTLVHPNRPLLRIVGDASSDPVRKALANAFTVERHRRFDHDPRLGVIALGEIAGRACPRDERSRYRDRGRERAVPGTLAATGGCPAVDADRPPVYMARPSADELVRGGFVPIIREGAGEEEVVIRTRKVLDALGKALPHGAETTQSLSDELRRNVERNIKDDRALLRALEI